jgi:hypothetical protein
VKKVERCSALLSDDENTREAVRRNIQVMMTGLFSPSCHFHVVKMTQELRQNR